MQLAADSRKSGPEHRSAHQPRAQDGNKDGPGAFLLDLQNFPDLSKADINRQNPNIQVPSGRGWRLFQCIAKRTITILG